MSGKSREFIFEARDGYQLSAREYCADCPAGTIIIASAIGVPQGYYRRFAEYAAQHGFNVITFDYRGIGKSAPLSLKGFDIDFMDWARQDLSSLVEQFSINNLPLFLVGHSYGGQALGLLNNHNKLQAAYFLGVGSGWQGWMPRLEQLRVRLLWNVIAPVVARFKGYLAWSMLGMGADLPLGVYTRWKRWCGLPNYFFDDNDYPGLIDTFATVKTPIKAVNAIDDKWASPQARDALIRYYQSNMVVCQNVEPRSLGLSEVGHMGYFRSKCSMLWPDVLVFFKNHTNAAQ